jgi:hypothetical protein
LESLVSGGVLQRVTRHSPGHVVCITLVKMPADLPVPRNWVFHCVASEIKCMVL